MPEEPTIGDVLAALDGLEGRVARRLEVIDLELRALRAQITLLEASFTGALADHVQRGHQ